MHLLDSQLGSYSPAFFRAVYSAVQAKKVRVRKLHCAQASLCKLHCALMNLAAHLSSTSSSSITLPAAIWGSLPKQLWFQGFTCRMVRLPVFLGTTPVTLCTNRGSDSVLHCVSARLWHLPFLGHRSPVAKMHAREIVNVATAQSFDQWVRTSSLVWHSCCNV